MGGISRDTENARSLQREFDEIESRWIAGEITIKNKQGKALTPPGTPGLYKMCYKNGKKYHRQLHKYWFVSKAGNVISLESRNHPIWQSSSGGERNDQYRITKNKANKLKRDVIVSDYMLVALVYGSRIIGRAKSILEKRGLEAIEQVKHDRQGKTIYTAEGKRAYAYDGVCCHHIDGYDKDAVNQKKNCNPDRLVIITNSLHDLFETYVSEKELTFSDVNDFERHLQEFIETQRKNIRKVKNIFDREGMSGNINFVMLTGNKHGPVESYENLKDAKTSAYYEDIKGAYFTREAVRLSYKLQYLGIKGLLDYPVVIEEEDRRHTKTNGIRHDFKIFRYREGHVPIEVTGYYDQKSADQVYQTLYPILYY